MTDPITTTVTWDDLITQNDDELDDAREAYDEVRDLAEDEYGDGALDRPLPNDLDAVPEDMTELFVYQLQAAQYEEVAKSCQARTNVLRKLREEYGEGDFEIKMLTGQEAIDIETELRVEVQNDDAGGESDSVGREKLTQSRRNMLTTDAATVAAPEGVPREDGSPVPSECPNPLPLSLWQHAQRYNNAGDTDFRPAGLGSDTPLGSGTSESSATPTTSGGATTPSSSTDG